MPSAVPSIPRAGPAPPDELDRLLDYDNAVDDFLRDLPIGEGEQADTTSTDQQPRDEDQEVQVRKKRAPVPKLDENRLLSQAGIPKLRKIAKTRLKFRGKGHEFSDMSRLLNTYQLWLDDLYPRAKFRDALTMVEKVGHSKRMQVVRKAWLDETKPHHRGQSPDVATSDPIGVMDTNQDDHNRSIRRDEDLFAKMVRDRDLSATADAPEGDELDALLAEDRALSARQQPQPNPRAKGPFAEHEPDEDDLDALLAEQDSITASDGDAKKSRSNSRGHEPNDDELGALMGERSTAPRCNAQASYNSRYQREDTDFADEEEVLAGMDGMW
ncbi:hypothetical protein DOTSEDRAFT_55546 [Dothistroma septosporum NZE10]|uniref:Chromosome segregation in meiosis protein n=1 Tax=Dothistroma septosporum (strain NZE10 / CBS 128990) TaxID=675120 RepID=N1PI77_DOTSN|nr:hypothetical protein DOTSEDRAFT_55546 [Dothistroma septosporum NZE10]